MKQPYADITAWLRFNAWMALHEMQCCNDGWIVPCVGLFLEHPRPGSDVPERLLSLIEEVASAMWLMQSEHDALFQRVRELSGSRQSFIAEDLAEVFEEAAGDRLESLHVARSSLAARVALIEAHGQDVDAHTRLVLRRHALVIRNLLEPTLAAVAQEAMRIEFLPRMHRKGRTDRHERSSETALIERYRDFLPLGPRAHPDTFLASALLHSGDDSIDA